MKTEILRISIVLVAGILGSIGFALVFGVGKKHFIAAIISSVISCLAFEIVYLLCDSLFTASFVGAGLSAAYSDIMSQKAKTPATLFIIIGIIPLVPGAKLYYTMLGIVRDDVALFSQNGEAALLIAAGIAVGIITVTAVSKPIKAKISEINAKNHKAKE